MTISVIIIGMMMTVQYVHLTRLIAREDPDDDDDRDG
jgi:hypothetical protein